MLRSGVQDVCIYIASPEGLPPQSSQPSLPSSAPLYLSRLRNLRLSYSLFAKNWVKSLLDFKVTISSSLCWAKITCKAVLEPEELYVC